MRKSLFVAAFLIGSLLVPTQTASAHCWGWGCYGYGWCGYGWGGYGYYGPYWGWGATYYAPYAYYPGYYYPTWYPYYWGWGGYYSPWGYGWGWIGQNGGVDGSAVALQSRPVTEATPEAKPVYFVGVRRPVTEGQEEAQAAMRLAGAPKPVSEATQTRDVSADFAAFPSK